MSAEKLNVRLGRRSQRFAPGFSWCFRCLTPWKFVKLHDTKYELSRGCFPLCEKCWAECSIAERLPFYDELIATWERLGPPVSAEKREAIRAAVEAGL